MKYKWDVKEIRENINKLEKYLACESYKNIIELTEEYLDSYHKMLKMMYAKGYSDFDFFDENHNFKNYRESLYLLKDYIKNCDKDILNTVINSYSVLLGNNFEDLSSLDNPIKINNNEVIDICEDFFKSMLPDAFYREIKYVLNFTPDIININYNKHDRDFSGFTLIDPLLKKVYISVTRKNQTIDLSILPHEFFHYLFFSRSFKLGDYTFNYLNEVEGHLANLLFGDYYYKNFDSNYIQKFYLSATSLDIEELAISKCMYDSSFFNLVVNSRKFNKKIKKLGIDSIDSSKLINSYLDDVPNLESNLVYTFSYLAALDLYYIYHNDRDKAFYLLQNIKDNEREKNTFEVLRNNEVTFMDDGYNNLKKYIKQINK